MSLQTLPSFIPKGESRKYTLEGIFKLEMHVRHLQEISRDLELGVKVIQISECVEQVVVDKTLRRHRMMREEIQR